MIDRKPSEKIVSNIFDGQEITDSLGRKLKLKKPDILDLYDLMSAIGEDSKSAFCHSIAVNALHIAVIDNQVIQSPKSYAEFRATLKKIGEEGLTALMEYMATASDTKSEKEQIAKVKK